MAFKAPLIDARTPGDIAEQTRKLLCHYLSGAPYNWNAGDDGGEAGKALTGVFGHYCGLVVDRVNRATERNLLTFLELLGNAPVPPMPARVPLSFFLDPTATEGIAVASGTRAQAEPPAGSADPVVFETERDLWLTTFELKAFDKTPANGLPARDVTRLILTVGAAEARTDKQEGIFDQAESLHFGLDLAANRALPENRPVSLFFYIDNAKYDPTVSGRGPGAGIRVVWEYSSAGAWKPLLVEDGTESLSRTGGVEFLVPADFSRMQRHLFERKLFWIRAHLEGPASPIVYQPAPRLKGVTLNTVFAQQAMSMANEILGSSDGSAGQRRPAFRKPVLPGQRVEVFERRSPIAASTGDAGETWTPWQEVANFYASSPQDRHYTIDRSSAEIRFGDGTYGMIPPSGTRNIRLGYYQTTSGSAGNIAVGTLKTLVAGQSRIRGVTNYTAADGGAAAETTDALLERAPRALRHRGRAVTAEDYEDLAKLASGDVARAWCVPLIDLAAEPCKVITTVADEESGAGKVSVIVVPRTPDAKPLPSHTLMERVATYLSEYSLATTSLSVVGPLYLRIGIEVHLRLLSLQFDDRVKRELGTAFTDYLHPLTGRGGLGWPFGRRPHDSDIHRLIRKIAGIDHVSFLQIKLSADETPLGARGDALTAIAATGRFLICSGRHSVITS